MLRGSISPPEVKSILSERRKCYQYTNAAIRSKFISFIPYQKLRQKNNGLIKGDTNPHNNLISYERRFYSEQNTANHKFIRYSYLKLSSSKVIKNPDMEAAILFSKQTGSDVIYSVRRIYLFIIFCSSRMLCHSVKLEV